MSKTCAIAETLLKLLFSDQFCDLIANSMFKMSFCFILFVGCVIPTIT